MLEKVEKLRRVLRLHGIDLIYRYIEPNSLYNKRYNIITDGIIQEYSKRHNEVTNSTMVCNLMKDLKVVYINKNEEMEDNIDVLERLCFEFDVNPNASLCDSLYFY